MNVRELNANQLEELKNNMFWNRVDYGELEPGEADVLDIASCPEEIPDELIYNHYEGYCFVPDDFWCSAGRDE